MFRYELGGPHFVNRPGDLHVVDRLGRPHSVTDLTGRILLTDWQSTFGNEIGGLQCFPLRFAQTVVAL